MTRRSKQACCPARTSVIETPPGPLSALGSDPQVIPQYGVVARAAPLGAPAASASVSTAQPLRKRFMALPPPSGAPPHWLRPLR